MEASKKNILITLGLALVVTGGLFFAFGLKNTQENFPGVTTTPPPESDITFQNKSISKIEYFEQKIEEKNSAYKRDRNHKPFTMVKGVVPDTVAHEKQKEELIPLNEPIEKEMLTLEKTEQVVENKGIPNSKIIYPKTQKSTGLKKTTTLLVDKDDVQSNQGLKRAKVYAATPIITLAPVQETVQIVKASVYKDHKIKAGEAVTFRLSNDLEWKDILLPANHFFTGQSSIQNGNRLQIKIEQVVLNGKIIPITIEVMDYDQLLGIKLGKGFSSNQAVSETAEDGLESALNLATRGMGNFLIDPLKKATKTQAIHLQDGYEVYLKFQP